jgi:hypothetical protein
MTSDWEPVHMHARWIQLSMINYDIQYFMIWINLYLCDSVCLLKSDVWENIFFLW